MKKLITKSNRLVEKGRMIGMGLLSLALLMSSSLQPVTAAMNTGKLSVASGSKADIVVKGKIIDDKTGAPLAGVSVKIKGTTAGTTTDNAGNYTLTAPDNATLTISYIGYATQELPVNSRATINVNLMSSSTDLEEVVVVGYGTVKKKDLTGSVSSISAERLMDKPAYNVGQALQGKVSGVQVITAGGGVPGGNPIMRIRGSNSISSDNQPLFVVDGVVGVANALSSLNPEDISSMEVLKDASATAIYGARGANGVVMITTKRGISGKTVVDYNGYVTQGVTNRHVYTLTSDQMMYIYEQAVSNANKYSQTGYSSGKIFNTATTYGPRATGTTSYSDMPYLFKQVPQGDYFIDLRGADGNYYAPRFNSDWEDMIFNPALSNSHKLDVRGGNEDIKYSLGLGYNKQDGIMLESWQKRYNGRITGDIKVTKWLTLSSQLAYQRTFRTEDGGITRSAAEAWPILPVKYPDTPEYTVKAGRWGANQDFNVGEQWYNIMFIRASDYGRVLRQQTTGNIDLNGRITKDLGFKTSFSADLNTQKANSFTGIKYNANNSASASNNVSNYWQATAYFNYDKTIGSHTINAVLGTETSENTSEDLSASNNTFFSDWYGYNNLAVGTAARPGVGNTNGRSSLNSYFVRGNYSFKGKYLLTATARYDGSSKFGPDSKYGFFPSVGLAWNVTQEDFMKDVPLFSNLKIRGSYGQTGNQDISSNSVFGFVGSSNVWLNGAVQPGIVPSSVGNNDLHWEATAMYDAGLEVGLFKGRVNLEAGYYTKKTTDMLLSVSLPNSTTTGSITSNYGAIGNKGWEFSLNTYNFNGQDFKWSTTATMAMNRNKILRLGPTGADLPQEVGAGNATNVYRVGEPIGSFFGLNRLGTWGTNEAAEAARYAKVPGDLKFADTNQDGKIELLTDGGVIGRSWPKSIWGLNNTFSYKNFDAAIDIQVVLGTNKVFVHESAEDRQLVSGGLNTTLTAWRPDNQDTPVAQVRPGNSGPYYQSFPDNHMIYNSAFLRGSNATLGYRFPKELVNKIAVQNARLYVSSTNFLLITKAAGYDPEGNSLDKSGTSNQNAPGQDKYAYPNPTTFTLGLKVGF